MMMAYHTATLCAADRFSVSTAVACWLVGTLTLLLNSGVSEHYEPFQQIALNDSTPVVQAGRNIIIDWCLFRRKKYETVSKFYECLFGEW